MTRQSSTRVALLGVFALSLFASFNSMAEDLPPGFHRMPDGSLMANNPDEANPPPGYHMMPDGTLMANMPLDSSSKVSSVSHSHHHGTGAFMLRYQFMRMKMRDLLDGTSSRSPANVIADDGYMMAPKSMNMDMHMLMAMYGMTNDITLMAMLNYLEKSMIMVDASGTEQSMRSSGEGDIIMSALYRYSPEWLFSLGGHFPNGSIDKQGVMRMNNTDMNVRLPYSMQLGTGSFGLIPGVTYQTSKGPWTVGAKGEYTVFLQNNDNGYKYGNRLEISSWARWAMNHSTDFQVRAELHNWGKISGQDSAIAQSMSMPMGTVLTTPMANPANYGGTRMDVFAGLSGKSRSGGFGFTLEAGLPVYQNLNGPQMKVNAIGSLSLNWMF